jgi:flagellar hook-associated protein 1 FlgK
MSLSLSLQAAVTGLNAAQMGLRAVSDNIANVNTPGYVRTTVNQQTLVVGGAGMGVVVEGLQRLADQYLEAASQTAGSDASRWGAYSQYMDTAQGLFGDPSGDTYFFNRLDQVFAGFAAAANDPSSNLLRTQATANVQDFLSDARRINDQLQSLGGTMDTRIASDVSRANDLLQQIDALNADISRARLVNQDSTGAENLQGQMVNELTALIGLRVTPRQGGGVDIRSTEGVKLAGDGAARLIYNASLTTPGYISVQSADGIGAPTPIQVDSGEIRGLMDLRNTKLPQMSDQLGEFVQRVVEQLNEAHNASSAVPAPAVLTGRNTGLDLPSALANFSGQATVAVLDSTGAILRTVSVDFGASQLSVNGVPTSTFTPSTFVADMNAALGGQATMSFSNGALSLAAVGAGNGVAMDEGTSQKAGRGFSAYFGLNDLVRPSGLGTYDTGLTTADPHGFTAGDTITLRLSQPDGKPIRDVTVTVPAGSTMGDLLGALNDNTTGVGLYGQFALDSFGRMTFSGSQPTNAALSVVQDATERAAGGPSISQLFGLGAGERVTRADQFQVDPVIAGNSSRLAFARLDLTATGALPAVRPGDATGALALANAGDVNTAFAAAGPLGVSSMTLSRYASEFAGAIGRDSAVAASRKDAADAVKSQADNRLQSSESVNLDEELVNLTTFQQAFNASARMIQATKDLFDVLAGLV